MRVTVINCVEMEEGALVDDLVLKQMSLDASDQELYYTE